MENWRTNFAFQLIKVKNKKNGEIFPAFWQYHIATFQTSYKQLSTVSFVNNDCLRFLGILHPAWSVEFAEWIESPNGTAGVKRV